MTKKKDIPLMDRSLFYWVLRGKRSYQLLLLLAIFAIVFLRVLPLEIQKRLVNDVLTSHDYSRLLYYCLIYLSAVLSANALKFAINSLQTLIGEQATADIRREMYHHIMRIPLAFFRRTQPGTVVTALVEELATAGSFIGVAVAIPLSNILTLLAFAGYLLWLNPVLGLVTLSIYPMVFVIVPMVQKRADRANRKRVDTSLEMASQITESISGVQEIHAHGAFRTEEQKYNNLVERLLKTRIIWALYTYAVKSTNYLLLGLGPVLVFLVGGYMMMQGQLELGALVAFLSGQEKLYEPSSELTKFYQVYQDAVVRYKKVLAVFDGSTEFKLDKDTDEPVEIGRKIELKNLDFTTAEGIKILNNINLTVEQGEHLAVVGYSGSGKSTLVQCIGQICRHTRGVALLDGHPIEELSKEEIIYTIGYISQEPFIFSGTVDQNLMYAWEALLQYPGSSKNMVEPTLDDKIDVIQQTGLFVDILRFGMNTVVDHEAHPDLAEILLRVRKNFQDNFGKELDDYVEFFNKDSYLYHSNIRDNLIFGTILGKGSTSASLSRNRIFLSFLTSSGLRPLFLETGADLLQRTVEILGDVPREDIFFSQTPIKPGEYDDCLLLAGRLQRITPDQLEVEEQHLLMDIALRFTPARHKIIALQPQLEESILNNRQALWSYCSVNAPEAVAFYCDTDYIQSQSILNNIFFGNLTSDSPKVKERVHRCLVQLLVQEDLLERITAIGMEFDVGNKGDKLSGAQKQKLAIARVLLKETGVVIMDEATSSLDSNSQKRIQRIVAQWKGNRTVISVIPRFDMLPSFDKVAVLKDGKIIEWGSPDELITRKGALYELVHGKTH